MSASRAWPRNESAHGWRTACQCTRVPRLRARRCHLARRSRRPVVWCDEERRARRGGSGFLRPRRSPAISNCGASVPVIWLSKSRYIAAQLLRTSTPACGIEMRARAQCACGNARAACRQAGASPGRVERGVPHCSAASARQDCARGFGFYDWGASGPGQARFVVSWDQPESDVEALCAALHGFSDVTERQHAYSASDRRTNSFTARASALRRRSIPRSGRLLARVPEASPAQVDAAVAAAARAFSSLVADDPQERSLALLKLADRIESRGRGVRASGIAELRQAARSASSQMRCQRRVDALRFFAGASRSLSGPLAGEYLSQASPA